ncbi:MAG TPA: hypothetical protein VHL79_03720 [Ramlibacter sp.]|jgi:hypothetical protein|nr:hypothetical protein [Ramlibacter sp.]
MNKLSTRALIAAAAVAFGGAASAGQTFNVPLNQPGEASTMTGGAPNMLTHNEIWAPMPAPVVVYSDVDTTVLGAGPVITYPAPVVTYGYNYDFRGSASNNSSVPDRAGELSTITNGQPNLLP